MSDGKPGEVAGPGNEKHEYRVVDSQEGSLRAEFESVVDAVQCAMEIQEQLRVRNEALSEEDRIPFRIGVHLGEVTEEDGKVRGDGVDVAARPEELADTGAVCISGSAYDQVKGMVRARYESLGGHPVHSVAEPVRAYRVLVKPEMIGRAVGRTGLLSYLETRLDIVKVVIAVVPFENMTGDPKQEYFADGFTEEIITSLAKISSLFLISRNSSFTYKGKPVKVQQGSEELGVRYVLEGSIQKFSIRIRINVRLTDAISGQHVWAQSCDRDRKDIFALQDEVIRKITSALSVNLTTGEQARVWAEGTKCLEAYLKLMHGREYRYKGSRESNALARRMAEEAIALDPKYAEAYVLLGTTYYQEVFFGTSPPRMLYGRPRN